ncbi:DUF1043 family protein [uncultured Abyssibacter sp.]|uniref:ZapG family protein n=1 Tax=uncultured Abyssibacter sp. TaxID=2320202 RepID=UPI0032B1DEBF
MEFGPEISLVALFLGLLIGGALGFAIGRGSVSRDRQALKNSADAQAALKREMEAHLRETATLMDHLATGYQDVYAHLAEGARRFGAGDMPLSASRALTHEDESPEQEPGPHGAVPAARPRRDEPSAD